LSACGAAALGYFEGCKDEYKSASLDDVLRLRERADSLERQLVESRDYAISEAAKIRTEYERQQAVLVEALGTIKHSMIHASVLDDDVRREVQFSEETASAALAAVKGDSDGKN
jgi:hypothetical protein